MTPPLYLHFPDCTPDEVQALCGLKGRRIGFTASKTLDVATRVYGEDRPRPSVHEVKAYPNNLESGTRSLVVLELWIE